MGKKTKIGKQRKDKYYQLAKETGFRSRAAFKLIQLNRKFEFLQNSRVCIDLCAAPGGWMQVAQQNMPISSIIVGIDLYAIKPIAGCISLTEDITTDKCRTALGKELQTWKADVVLNDGAPNVGKNWLHDAYQQSCLCLSALKLATQFLRKGGWFVTKVFRSKDYNSLIWIFKQLFKKVHATKPQASRHESAEIFVVCQHYIAPDKIDGRFFDSKYVFQDLQLEPKSINVFRQDKQKKAKADGYAENDYTLHRTVSVKDFIASSNALDVLQTASEIVFDDETIANDPKTTKEIKECCKDIKVLGRKDVRNILAWWKALHDSSQDEEIESKNDVQLEKDAADEDEKEDGRDELDRVDEQVHELEEEERKQLKRKKKKTLKERRKLQEKMNLRMIHKGDEGPELQSDGMFNLKEINSLADLSRVTEQPPDELPYDEEQEIASNRPKPKMKKYSTESSHLDSSGLYYKDSESELEMESGDEDAIASKQGLGLNWSEEESEDDEFHESDRKVLKKKQRSERDNRDNASLLTDLDYRSAEVKRKHKAQLWFERDAFKNLINEKDEDADLDKVVDEYKKQGVSVFGEEHASKGKAVAHFSDVDNTDDDSDYNVEEEVTKSKKKTSKKNGFDVVKKENLGKRKLSVQELALGTMIINSKKVKRDIIDDAWNRYAFNDTHLPDWFAEDESKHMKREIPVSKELVNDYKKQMEELNVRPIKKVLEAKARKKRRALKKLEKVKKRVETLMDNEDVGNKEKAKQIRQMYKKATENTKKEVTYVVSKKYAAAKRARRPAGVKGPYKVVDPRMKKDTRAQKRISKKRGKNTRPTQSKRMSKGKQK